MGKVVVLGIDGATWDLLEVLMEKNIMPCLNDLYKDSARGKLLSTYPPVTAPSWISMATGVNPGKHGCFDFNKAENSLSRIRPLQSWDIQTETFYEILSRNGKKTILINLPGTYPPLTSEITITSLLTQGENCVFPESLKEEVDIFKNYRIFPDTSLLRKGDLKGYIKGVYEIERIRFQAMKHLWHKDWDCFFIVFSGGDWLSHEFFGEMFDGVAPEEAYEIFRLFDEAIYFAAKGLGEDDCLMIVSDHGFKKAKGILHFNEILFQNGFLEPDYENPSPPLSHKMEKGLFDRSDFKKVSERWLKMGMKNPFAGKFIKLLRKFGYPYPLFLKANPLKSKALMMTSESYGVTINDKLRFEDGIVDECDIEEVRDSLKNLLLSLEFGGEKLFRDIFYKEETYSGEFLKYAPDLIFGDSEWGYSSAVRTLEKNPFALVDRGIHSLFGVFLCYGRNITPQLIEKGEISVLDIAPLILYFLGQKIPDNLDGKVFQRIVESSYLEKHKIEFCEGKKPERERIDFDGEEIQKKLKSLGYMS